MSEGNSTLPLLSLQADWESVCNDVGEEFWISAKVRNQPSLQGKIKRVHAKVPGLSDLENFESSNDFKIERVIGNSILIVSHKQLKTLFLAPNQTLSNIHNREVVSVHTCDKSESKAVSASGNSFKQWDNKANGQISLEFKGHSGDINKVYYFPSGVVAISCSLDMQIKIVCTETGNNPRTLIGHTRSVTDLAIVSKGKNIISVSKDCRALLWNVADETIIAELIKTNFPILCCDLVNSNTSFSPPDDTTSHKGEFDTSDKILLLGCEGGSVYVIAIATRDVLLHEKLEADVKCVKFINDQQCLVGLSNGKVIQYQLKLTSNQSIEATVTKSWHYTDSCVQCILPCTQYGFFAGYHDGHCVFQLYDNDNCQVHLTGSLFDPIYDMTYDGANIYTACRDGKVRKYLFGNLLIEKAFLDK
uniref:Proteasomal ATPase-associated factor 1 n=1 Tax=Cacopsylla melanoneura TaxID=428564 RepID=A0A8D8YIC0_9HEMI